MTAARIHLASPLPEDLSAELAKRLYFVCDLIDGFDLVCRDGAVHAVDLSIVIADPSQDVATLLAAIEEKINRVVDAEVRTQRPMPVKVVWSAPLAGPVADPYQSLADAGAVFAMGEGQIGFGEPLLSLMDYLDRRLRAIAAGFDGAAEYRYPTLLPTSVLQRFGYFASFPQFVMFVTRLHNDADVYRDFLRDYAAGGGLPDDLFAYCRSQDYCLPPTMCYHTYHQLSGQRLAGDIAVTAKGKSFRFESRYRLGLERLWDFTIREMVFIGSADFAAAARDRVMRATFALAGELGLTGSCEVAHDHFFGDAQAAGKVLSQRMMELKYELLLDIGGGRRIAAGSFNLHGQLFGEAFEITQADGAVASSGCVGFGLERFTHAFLCQHGADTARWPVSVRKELG